MAGRKPKPAALKRLGGNPGKRKIKAGPKFARALPACPEHLSTEAKAEWRRVSRELFDAGLLVRVDRAALAAYCQTWSRWVKAEKALAKGKLTFTTSIGYEGPNPMIAIANKAMAQMRAFMTEFGMTPSSRAKVTVHEEPEDDPFEAFVRQKLGEGEGMPA
jgi:P27 family predicted phage terminase small subunit